MMALDPHSKHVPSAQGRPASSIFRLSMGARIALALYLAGILLRYLYIMKTHPATEYLFSDMEGYYRAAQQFGDPRYQLSIGDTVHPPGTRAFFGLLLMLDYTLTLAMSVQFVLSILVPPLLAGIALELLGRRTAWCVLGMGSLYYPFWDYAGYLLSEGPFLFAMLLSFWLMARSLRSGGWASAAYGLSGGLILGGSASFKSVSLPAALLVFCALILMLWKRKLRAQRTLVASSAGLLLVLTPLAVRCTKLNEGRFCLIANDAARNIYLGKEGQYASVQFIDRKRGSFYEFGSPSGSQKGVHKKVAVEIGVYENGKLLAKTLQWVKAHPFDSVLTSLENMFDLFYGTYTWPSSATPNRRWVVLYSQIFLLFILIPAGAHVWRIRKGLLRLDPRVNGDLLVLLPVVGIFFVAFITIGEPRYRIPFDGFILLLAARFYCGRQPDDPILGSEVRKVRPDVT